jgi:hypothetical protein
MLWATERGNVVFMTGQPRETKIYANGILEHLLEFVHH